VDSMDLTPGEPGNDPLRGVSTKASGSDRELSLCWPAKKGRMFNAASREFVYTVACSEYADVVLMTTHDGR
jgi:hypothetical protein